MFLMVLRAYIGLLGEIFSPESIADDCVCCVQGVAGSLFFWTFELLVFMVLLNFLLAIIVDAFSVVKACLQKFNTFATTSGSSLQSA